MTVEAGCVLAAVQRGRGRGRPPVSALARRRRQLPDRRQPLDQRRRRQRAALWQRARAGARPGSRAARRPGLGRAARPAQGQHRLRPEAALPRRRRHARRDHRSRAAALPQAHRQRHGVDRARQPGAGGRAARRAARARVGERISAFELVSRTCLEAVLAHLPDARDPLGAPHPWTVLAEFGDSGAAEDAARADRRSARRLTKPCSRKAASRRARSGACARAFRRRSSATSSTTSRFRSPRFREFIELRRSRAEVGIHGAPRSSASGMSATATCTTTSARQPLVAQRDAVNRVVYDAVERLRRLDLGRARARPAQARGDPQSEVGRSSSS